MRHSLTASFIAAAALLAACDGGRDAAWDRSRAVIGPIPLNNRVAYIDGARDQVVFLDASATPRVHHVKVGRHPIYAAPTPDRKRLAVITRGQEAFKKGEVDEEPGLYLIEAEVPEPENVPPLRYEIGSPFDRLSVAADGSVAVAYFSEGGPDEEGLFRNPNELAIVNLAAPPAADENPVLRTVRSFGSAPLGVTLSPPMAIPGAEDPTPRTLVYVLAPNTVTVLDATYPLRREVTIKLTLGTATLVTPKELAFAPQAGAAYLRADGARDVLSIILTYEAPTSDTDNDFQPALSELGAGGTPADVAVYDDALGVRRVLVATPGTHELTVIEADTAEFVSVDTGNPVDRILLLPPEAPRVAVLASIGNRLPRVHLLDLQDIGETLTPPQLETVELSEPIFDVVAVPQRELVMVVHDDARTVLGLLDVTTSAVSPLEGAGRLDTYDFAAGGTYLVGATSGIARVGVIQLDNLHPDDVRLDDLPGQVFALPNGAVFIDHGDVFGRATILPSAASRRDQAVVLSGFLLTGILDEEF